MTLLHSRFHKHFPVFFFLLFSTLLYAQKNKKVELIHANALTYDETAGGKVRHLTGDVKFRQDNIFLYCDSAFFYSETNAIDAFSNVRIVQGDSLNLYGDVLKYDGNRKQAEMFRNIRMNDGKITLTTDHISYDMKLNIASYSEGGKIIDGDNTLTSKTGYYYSSQKDFFFKKNVVLLNPDYKMTCDTLKYNGPSKVAYFLSPTFITSKEHLIYCENGWYDTEKGTSRFSKNAYLQSKEQKLKGDSILFDRISGNGKAFGNIEITDTIERIVIRGDYAEYFQKHDSAMVTGHTLFIQIFETDSMYLHADTLTASGDSAGTSEKKQKRIMAYHHVKIFKPDLQGKCDSLAYSAKDSSMEMYKAPILWSDKNQLTAEHISMELSRNRISKLLMLRSSFIISQEDSVHYNQVKGKKMTGHFENNKLHDMLVEGNGETIYYAKDNNNRFIGVNKAVCSDILILIHENKVNDISLLKKPEAAFHPMGELGKEDLFLKGFTWRGDERPGSREDIF